MRVGKRPRPVHHLGGWWEACPQELGEDCCQRAEIFWPINKAHVKKYKLGVKTLTACRNMGEESWKALRAQKVGQGPERGMGRGDVPERCKDSKLGKEQ